MKRIILLISVLCLVMQAEAQPSWTKKASKGVLIVKTFATDGTFLGSTTAFIVGEQGEAIGCFAPFRGAASAVAIDAQGKEWPVDCVLGANDTYDVVKFRVDIKKPQPLTVVSSTMSQGDAVWLLPFRETKQVAGGTVSKVESFNDDYAFYTIAMQMPEGSTGAPLLNEAGEVVGVMQQPYGADSVCYAVSASFADSLHITGLSINDPTLRSTLIKKALPADEAQAQLSLYMGASALDSASYAQLIEDYIVQFPQSADGYVYRAQLKANANLFEDADRDIAQAVRVAAHPDEPHYNYSQMIYQKAMYRPQPPYEAWSLDKALEEARTANAINPQPTYRYQEATVLFAQQHYEEAYTCYDELLNGALRSPDLFFEASRCKEQLGDTLGQLALLDSMVALFSRPYLKEAAPYILTRAQARMNAGKNRDAVNDLNDYEQLMVAQVTDQFYYLRFQAEVGGRLFQQALNDINRAISMNPQQEFYLAEKASLQVRVGLYDDAIVTANECIRLEPQMSDGYLFLGLAQCLKGLKEEGVKNLRKASEMGDPQAETLIQRYAQ